MKRGGNIITKVLVLSLSVIYLIIALTYINFLPRDSNPVPGSKASQAHNSRIRAGEQLMVHNTGGSHTVVQKFYKSTPEHKRDFIVNLLQAAFLLASILFGVTMVPGFGVKGSLLAYADSHRYAYLHLRSLRL
jgi:hypothetical protein